MCANWAGDNRDRPMSPDRNDHYQLDNVGLQIGLGLPLQLLGVSLMNNSLNRIPRQNGNRGRGRGRGGYRRNNYQQNQNRKLEIQKTLDGIPIRKLYITNISIETRHQELRDIFCRFGHIHLIYMGVSKNDSYKQFAFITFVDPMAAARVLSQERFQDMRGRTLFAMAADSWHQPRERPDGTIDWEPGRKTVPRHEEEGEEDEEQSTEEAPSQIETEINEGSLNMLDDDCLLYIFSFLSLKEVTGVERVCKRWQALSFRMWRCLHELNFHKDGLFRKMPCNTKVLDQYLKRCGPSLTSLDLRTSGAAFKDNTLVVVAKHCENLEALKVSNIPVARRSLAHLGRSCPRLKKITMEGCTKVSDYDLNCLLPKCADLRELELSSISDLTGKCLANVKSPVTSLQLSCLLKMEPQYLIKGLKQLSGTLERVSLNACTHLPRMKEVVSEIVAAVPNLSSFSLTQCTMNLDPRSLVPLGQLKKLTSLDLHLNNSVNDTALSAIVEGCEDLTSLNLSGSGGGCAGMLSERGLSMLARLRKLTHLNISYLEATNNAALKNFTARNCKLKSLVCRGCPELTDEGTETVVTLSNELELFDLSGCKGVSVKTAETALTSVKMRTNNTPLRIIVGGTMISCSSEVESDSPLLTVDLCDHCEDHLRPDFIDDMFFPPSDDDSDDDFDHLCERIAFMFGDIWEEFLPSDYEDSLDGDTDEDFDSDIENLQYFI